MEYLKLSQTMLEFSLNGGHEINFDDMLAKAEKIQSTIPKLQKINYEDRSISSPTMPRHVTIAELESAVIIQIVTVTITITITVCAWSIVPWVKMKQMVNTMEDLKELEEVIDMEGR